MRLLHGTGINYMNKMNTLFENIPTVEVIRVIWLNNPFGHLMEYDKIETRNRETKVRGKVLICSCMKPYSNETVFSIAGERQYKRIQEVLRDVNQLNGYAICIGDLVGCRPMEPKDEDICFVRYRPGLWCWVFANVQSVEPFPYKGKQGWVKLSSNIPQQKAIIDKIVLKNG